MDRQKREALVSYLPKHAFIEVKGGDHVDVRWSTPKDVFRLDTKKDNPDAYVNNTRVTIVAEKSFETVVLVTEDWSRVVKALELLGAL